MKGKSHEKKTNGCFSYDAFSFDAVYSMFKRSSSTSSSSKEKASIKISTWAGADESKEFQKIIDKLNEKSTEYKIVQDSNPADYDTRLTTQLSGKGGPDIFWVSAQRASQLAAKGAMLDITDKLSSSKKDAAKTSDYFEESLAPFKNNGKIYGLPWIMQPVVMYYNKDLFDKAGVSYPDGTWNWDKFTDAAKTYCRLKWKTSR